MDDMSTTLIMNETGFTHAEDGFISMPEWAALNDVTERTVKRWLADKEIPGAKQVGPKKRWAIPETAVRISEEERAERKKKAEALAAQQLVTVPPTTPPVVAPPVATPIVAEIEEPEDDLDVLLADVIWNRELRFFLDRMPAYIPLAVGAHMLGLGIEYIRARPEEFEIISRGGRQQKTVMSKVIVMRKLGLTP